MSALLSYLLEHGGCSIRYRIMKEVMNIEITNDEMLKLQGQIKNKNKVKKILERQQADGWIGNELHGNPGTGLDSSVSVLLDNGVNREDFIMQRVAASLLAEGTDRPYRTSFKGGEALDLGGRGGNKAVKAGILADLGEENNSLVQDEMETGLSYLKDSLAYKSIDDFSSVNKRGIRFYNTNAHFPGANHLNLLSATESWRTDENMDMVKGALEHCMNIMRGKSYNIMFKSNTHFVGPFNFKWNLDEFDISEIEEDSYALVWWLRSLQRISKIGIVRHVPGLKKAYDYLFELVQSEAVVNKQSEAGLKRFKDILSVENCWRKKEDIYCDVMFYGVMILFYAGYDIAEL